MSFSRLSKRARNLLKLKWIVKDFATALDAINGNSVITEEDVKSFQQVRYIDSLREKMVSYSTVRKYCTKDAYNKALCLVKKVSEKTNWHCGVCKRVIKGRSISCDRCLMWFHFGCSAALETDFSDWYCYKCRSEVEEGIFIT